ncbi:putative PEP-binding protein, partial [Staphylococcus epidermidis]|uniref:putative PEP-binding protein n=1 Tax=Staphylococcus epidermidis TaxID=1282 RepID=UPI0021B46E78
MIGSMIERARGWLIGNEVGKDCDLLSFGSNDLRELRFGLCRDDGGKLINVYSENKILEVEGLESLDREGVGGV